MDSDSSSTPSSPSGSTITKKSKNARKKLMKKEGLLTSASSSESFNWKLEFERIEQKWSLNNSINASSKFSSGIDTSGSVYATEIIDYLSPFLSKIKSCGGRFQHGVEEINKFFINDISAKQKLKTESIKKLLKVEKLVVASVELELPLSLILEFNCMEEDDPRVFQYRAHPLWGNRK